MMAAKRPFTYEPLNFSSSPVSPLDEMVSSNTPSELSANAKTMAVMVPTNWGC